MHALWDQVLDSQRWTEGPLTARFEEDWGRWNGLGAVAFSSWSGAALAALEYVGVRDAVVLCPSNTFMATPLLALRAGASVEFVDCNRDDLCMSVEDLERKIERHRPRAVIVVHIGGHIAFDIDAIAALCRDRGIVLLEDCAHAHGASWNGRRPGSWGLAGMWSFYATKTVSTGEGGMLVSADEELLEFARAFRNYGKPAHVVEGLSLRMTEFAAALGVVATARMEEIVQFKNRVARRELDVRYPARLELPDGMRSGLYKYIVFDRLESSTGRVYDTPCHRIMGRSDELPNTDWVAANHSCVPLYYRGELAGGVTAAA